MKIEALSGRVVIGGVSFTPAEAAALERELHMAVAKATSQDQVMRDRWYIERNGVKCIECGEKADFIIHSSDRDIAGYGGCYNCGHNAGDPE